MRKTLCLLAVFTLLCARDAPVIAALLDSLQVTALDYVLNTHPHHDHLAD